MSIASKRFGLSFLTVCLVFASSLALGSVESSLMAVQNKLINVILPLAGILGLVFAAFSFFTGNANARSHLFLAMMGAVIGFGAPSIIAFIRGMIN
ncbi:MAG: hypothetical protein WCI18_02880 [Pseudomonadota bacterium]